jgi:hypothetical protein
VNKENFKRDGVLSANVILSWIFGTHMLLPVGANLYIKVALTNKAIDALENAPPQKKKKAR